MLISTREIRKHLPRLPLGRPAICPSAELVITGFSSNNTGQRKGYRDRWKSLLLGIIRRLWPKLLIKQSAEKGRANMTIGAIHSPRPENLKSSSVWRFGQTDRFESIFQWNSIIRKPQQISRLGDWSTSV